MDIGTQTMGQHMLTENKTTLNGHSSLSSVKINYFKRTRIRFPCWFGPFMQGRIHKKMIPGANQTTGQRPIF